jgi:hypothetical protein
MGLAFEFANYWAREDEGSVLIGTVRGDDGNFPVTVDYATSDGTATNGVDYVGITNTASFAAGEKVRLFTIAVLNDGLKEANKTFRVSLSNPTGGSVLGTPKAAAATVNVVDNDPGVQFAQNRFWIREQEGTVLLTVNRGNDRILHAFNVHYATANGTASRYRLCRNEGHAGVCGWRDDPLLRGADPRRRRGEKRQTIQGGVEQHDRWNGFGNRRHRHGHRNRL